MRLFLTVLLLLVMWSLLSGMFDAMHLGSGLVIAVLIAVAAERWRYPERLPIVRMIAYAPWLAVQIVRSNLHVARLVLTPSLPIAPGFVEAQPLVEGPHALTLLGCSITLTPGTVTVDIAPGRLLVHTLDANSVEGVKSGALARKVGAVYGQTVEENA